MLISALTPLLGFCFDFIFSLCTNVNIYILCESRVEESAKWLPAASLVLSRLELLLNFFDRIAAAFVAFLFYPRFALIKIMLSHRKQKYLPYTVAIIDFCRILAVI